MCSSVAFPTLKKATILFYDHHHTAYLSRLPLGHCLPECCYYIWYLSIDRKKRCETRIADRWPREVSGSGLVSVKDLSVIYHLLLNSSWRLEVLASQNWKGKTFSIVPVCPDQHESIGYMNIHRVVLNRDEDKLCKRIYEPLNQIVSIDFRLLLY